MKLNFSINGDFTTHIETREFNVSFYGTVNIHQVVLEKASRCYF